MLWRRLASAEYPNGIVIFCSKDLLEVFHPLQPLNRQIYLSGRHFDTSVIAEAMEICHTSYGLIVIDGEEATLGIAHAAASHSAAGINFSKLAHVSSNIASRTRRGGQSALRYSRLRDGAELAFLRKVAEKSTDLFSDVCGLVIGGKAEMKRKLLLELPLTLRDRVACVVDLSCGAGLEGLQQLSRRIDDVCEKDKVNCQEQRVHQFLELVEQSDLCATLSICYGEEQTMAAMKLGAVEQLLVASSSYPKNCLRRRVFEDLAKTTGASVIEVEPKSSFDIKFCQGFQIGCFLRWQVDSVLVDDNILPDLDDNTMAESMCDKFASQDSSDAAESDIETVSTTASKSDNLLLLQWLERALTNALTDAHAAENLTICAAAILDDDSSSVGERMQNTTDMLREQGVPEEVLFEFSLHMSDFQEDDVQGSDGLECQA